MADKRQDKKISSSRFQGLKSVNRPPAPNTRSTACMPFRAPPSPESIAGSSRALLSIDDLQTLSESARPDRNMSSPQRSIAMFSDIERVDISGGTFIQNIYNRDDNILRSLPRSHDAAFNAAINLDNLARRPCTKGTRVDIIKQILGWVNETDTATAPPVYWLTGLAGLGKTTIVYTICELLTRAHLPFASFFCSLQLDSRNSKLLVTTLCRDLAELYKDYAANVALVLETNSRVVDSGLRIQIRELLVKPWQVTIAQRKDLPTPIVVVDALDESDHGTEFLEELLHVLHVGHLEGIKFLVTSRPDAKIVDLCKSFPPNAVCKLHEVDTANVRNDIKKYLWEALPALRDEPELALLSERAGGLFIYATTAVRFISPPYNPPSVSEMRSHLQALLNPEQLALHSDSHEPLLVDELYAQILGDAFRDARVRAPRLRILHSIVCAESAINASVLADLTNTDQDTVKRVVESLHAVLFVSSQDGCVYWYHASFPDFVFSQARARTSISVHQNYPTHHVFCDPPAHHGVLAQRCFSVMKESLHFNMCNLPSSYLFDSEVPGLDDSIDKTFTPTLRYVSKHWATHLLRAVPAKNRTDELFCGLKDFLDNQLLFWMEAMNLIGAKFECSSLLKEAESWLLRGKAPSGAIIQLSDAMNFSAFFAGSPASKSTPHLYISALPMWKPYLPIWRTWRGRFKFIPSISLPKAAITIPLLTRSTTHAVRGIAISPDGNRYISCSDDGSVRVWDAKTGEQLMELQGHTQFVTSVTLSPDGSRIISGSGDGPVGVWDAKTGNQLRNLQGHTDRVNSVAVSPDGDRIVSVSNDKSVRVWDAKTGEQVGELQGHTQFVASVTFSSDGSRIISGSAFGSVEVWDAKTGNQLRDLQGHADRVNSVAVSPDGDRIVSGSDDKLVRVWDAKTGEQVGELQGHTDCVNSVAFSADGNRILSGSGDRSVRVWDVKTGNQLRKLQGHTNCVNSVAFSPDGNRILSGSADKSVCVWDAKVDKQWRGLELQGHTEGVRSVAFASDGNRIISGSDDKSVRVWDATTGKQLRGLKGHTSVVTSVASSADSTRIVSGSYNGEVRVWGIKTGLRLIGHTSQVPSVSLSPDGNRIVSSSWDRSVRVWDAQTGELLRKLQAHTDWVHSAAFSPDGNRIVSGSWDKSMRVWDAKTGEQLKVLQGHTRVVTSVGFSPDGNQIVSGSYDRTVRVWNAKTGEQLRVLRGGTGAVTSVGFSPDGDRIVSGDRSVRVWNAKKGEQLRELQGHTGAVTSVGFSPDGDRIVSGSDDESVRVWGNLNDDAPWVINEDGWIVSGAERLVWVPLTIRNLLLRPHNILIISRNGSATISFAQCKLGTLWHECYTP